MSEGRVGVGPKANPFFVNGHRCEVKYVRRGHTEYYVDGEKLDRIGRRSQVIEDAKWREEVEPDFGVVAESIYRFLSDVETWMAQERIGEAVFPNEEYPDDLYQALVVLENDALVERQDIYTYPNYGNMWRATGGDSETVNFDEYERIL